MMKAKADAGEDMMKMMLIVLPVAMTIQQSVIQKYGFSADQLGTSSFVVFLSLGVTQFTQAIRAHESDPEIANLAKELKEKFMPKSFQYKP
jgi:hypothetical protein